MGWFTGTVLFLIIWWTVLFAVLPFGTRPVADADSQTGWRGVPERPQMGRKVLVTTLVALVLWGGAMVVVHSHWLSFRDAAATMPDY